MFPADMTGVQQAKISPHGFRIDTNVYQTAADWVSCQLRIMGYEPVEAQYDPYQEMWYFRDARGGFIAKVSMHFLERVHEGLFALSRATDPVLNGRSVLIDTRRI